MKERTVSSAAELQHATNSPQVSRILVARTLTELRTTRLPPGQALLAKDASIALKFGRGEDGLQVTTDNIVQGLDVCVEPHRRAIFNDTSVDRLDLALRDLRVRGRLEVLANHTVRSGHVEATRIRIVAADARSVEPRPEGYGVEVILGAFTLWNQSPEDTLLTANLAEISAGRPDEPVRGSGLFLSGNGPDGGRLVVRRLDVGAVYSDGGIPPGTPNRISAGVFIGAGAFVADVHNRGAVTTYGPNDMVLDNWGSVDEWTVDERLTSFGPSAIGFVNFGELRWLKIAAPIETFGRGARGFNVYDGTVGVTEFERIVTHGDGAVGIQISEPVGEIIVRRGIETHGSVGDSLVKGVVTTLSAVALSVKRGGSAKRITVCGGITTRGNGVDAFEMHGAVDTLQIRGGISTAEGGSVPAQPSGMEEKPMTPNEQAVVSVLEAYSAALNASDTNAVMPLYGEDGVFMPPFSSSAVGRDAVRKAYDAVFAKIKLSVKFTVVEVVEMCPDWAFARTNSAGTTVMLATGATSGEANQELFLFRRGPDGGFKIARYSFSSTNLPSA